MVGIEGDGAYVRSRNPEYTIRVGSPVVCISIVFISVPGLADWRMKDGRSMMRIRYYQTGMVQKIKGTIGVQRRFLTLRIESMY